MGELFGEFPEMKAPNPPRLFTSYSHDSPEHERRVLALSDRLREEGIDAMLDQYESSPPEGWPFWMERQIREADFVLIVCTETYLRRVEHREEAHRGHGVLWESNIIYNYIYSDRTVSKRFVPILFDNAFLDNIPTSLKGFTRCRMNQDYEMLYRFLTNQTFADKPQLGKLKKLLPRGKSQFTLPDASSLEALSKTMSNPRYAEDLLRLDRIYDRNSIINRETVIVVVGATLVADLLDRSAAELLRDQIDQRDRRYPFRRGVVLTDRAWYDEADIIGSNPVISVGGPPVNRLSDEFNKWEPPPSSGEGKYPIPGEGARFGFFRRNSRGLPQVGLWGHNANDTRESVVHYFNVEQGLNEFLRMSWIQK